MNWTAHIQEWTTPLQDFRKHEATAILMSPQPTNELVVKHCVKRILNISFQYLTKARQVSLSEARSLDNLAHPERNKNVLLIFEAILSNYFTFPFSNINNVHKRSVLLRLLAHPPPTSLNQEPANMQVFCQWCSILFRPFQSKWIYI